MNDDRFPSPAFGTEIWCHQFRKSMNKTRKTCDAGQIYYLDKAETQNYVLFYEKKASIGNLCVFIL